MIPHLNCREGDQVFVRAVVVTAGSDRFQLRFEDAGSVIVNWLPACEVSKAEDIGNLKPMIRSDLKYIDQARCAPRK